MNKTNTILPDQAKFDQERQRLLATLGKLIEGGIVENLQHIGATSVPNLPPSPILDIGLSVIPFPLQPDHQAALTELGYKILPGYEGRPEQRFRHFNGSIQLLITEAGDDRWANYLLVRDYLRHSDSARREYAERKAALSISDDPTAKAQLFGPLITASHQWWINRAGFEPVHTAAAELKDGGFAWYVSSGWALDLFLNQVCRVHLDIDVVVPRSDQLTIQHHLTGRGWQLLTPMDGKLEPWPAHMRLEMPRHQVHAHRDDTFLDLLISQIEHGIWYYRREPTIIRHMTQATLMSEAGIPILAPELVLLFKSQNTGKKDRGKDQLDFERVFPHLEPTRRAWLYWALQATDPNHDWLNWWPVAA